MKKIFWMISLLIIILSFSCVFASENIVISPQKVMVDGIQKDFEVYNIDGNNFFKLRDIAYVLNKTNSQFSVDYNSETHMIETKKNNAYVAVGGEMNVGTDKSNTAVKSSQKLVVDKLEKELVAYNIGGNNFFKLRDLGAQFDFGVDFNSAVNSVVIESKKEDKIVNITNVVAKTFDGVMYVELTTDVPLQKYTVFSLPEPNRIILDINNSFLKIDSKEIIVSYKGLNKVRLGDQGNSINRVVLDVDETSDYQVIQSDDKLTTCLVLSKKLVYSDLIKTPDKVLLVYNGNIIGIHNESKPDVEDELNKTEPDIKDNVSGEIRDDKFSNISGEVNSSGENDVSNNISGESDDNTKDKVFTEEELKNRIKITSIKYASSTNKLKINGSKDFEYEAFTLKEPHRVIVDIKNAVLEVEGPTSITPQNKNITAIRFSQNDVDVVRVVFDVKKESDYSIDEKSKGIEVKVEENDEDMLEYKNLDEKAILTLYDVKKSVFKTSESSRKNTFTLTFSKSKFNPVKDKLEIEDSIVEMIEIETGRILIKGTGETEFSMKQDGDNVVITMKTDKIEKKENEDFIVLLDAGHGGSDPGSTNGDNYEKNFNLAILLELEEMLKENGYTVYVTRDKDVSLTVDDRVGLATYKYPEANMYISIHNNSVENDKYTGTLIMYCDRDTSTYNITNKELATYVLDGLVENLGTVNRGFIKVAENDTSKRVLTEVHMPSILCEVAFVSNDEEVARLATKEFQKAAALGIYEGILAAKEQMEK